MQNLVYEWVDFSKFGQIWAKIGSNLRKFWKKSVILFKIWPKIEPIGIWMGCFFFKNWYLYGSTFKFHGNTSLPKPNLSTPPGFHTHHPYVFPYTPPVYSFVLMQSKRGRRKGRVSNPRPNQIWKYEYQEKKGGGDSKKKWKFRCFSLGLANCKPGYLIGQI